MTRHLRKILFANMLLMKAERLIDRETLSAFFTQITEFDKIETPSSSADSMLFPSLTID